MMEVWWLIVLFVLLGGVFNYGESACLNYNTKKCKNEGIIGGIAFGKTWLGRPVRNYFCQNPQEVLNIPEETQFECCKNRTSGYYQWQAVSNKNVVADKHTLQCKAKAQCPKPPTPGANQVLVDISRYIKRVDRWNQLVNYYEGDTVQYNCKEGFEIFSTNDYDYFGDINSTMTVCNRNGMWDDVGAQDCQVIQCNATRFENITDGMIVNHTDFYQYGESMELQCDYGFEIASQTNTVKCESSASFDPYFIPDFRCTPILCPFPPNIMNGDPYYTSRTVNSTVTFACDPGYILSGQKIWTCQDDGKWDGYCARCNRDDTYCPAPCVPEGAELLNPLPTYQEGDTINFTCTRDIVYGGSVTRECLRNRQWSGNSIDCVGGRYRSVVMSHLLNKLHNITDTSDEPLDNNTDIDGKSMNIGQYGGVDVFLLVDVSGSIKEKEFNATKKFIIELLPPMNITDTARGTRLALYLFATNLTTIKNDHYKAEWTQSRWSKTVESLNQTDVQNKTSRGTAFYKALYEIEQELLTKQKKWKDNTLRKAQQVLVIISDGINTEGGDVFEKAQTLKGDSFGLEIISVCIQSAGTTGKDRGRRLMENLASKPKTETSENFFLISSDESDFAEIIKQMINTSHVCPNCGCTIPELTNYKSNNHYTKAKKNAWPWMVMLKKENGNPFCGGSIIKPHWMLTAAHCFKDNLHSIDINRLKVDDDKGVIELVELPPQNIFMHPKYNQTVKPKYLYDIALIYTPKEIPFGTDIYSVCLNISDDHYKKVFKDGADQYGVVTGWGPEEDGKPFSNHLKQMTMKIQPVKTCQDMDEKNEYNSSLMFCAGGQDGDGKNIDTCKGDSGGPFVVPYPDDRPENENTFVQVGIVSHGIGKCRQEGLYGIYTKLTPELVKWIYKTMEEHEENLRNE